MIQTNTIYLKAENSQRNPELKGERVFAIGEYKESQKKLYKKTNHPNKKSGNPTQALKREERIFAKGEYKESPLAIRTNNDRSN